MLESYGLASIRDRCPMCHGTLSSRIDSDVVAFLTCQKCGAAFKFSAVDRCYLFMTTMGSDPDRLGLTEQEKAYNDPRLWQEIDGAPAYLDREREEVIGGLCESLRQIGVKARLLDSHSPKALKAPRIWDNMAQSVLGCVEIEDRNLDVIIVSTYFVSGEYQPTTKFYRYYYVALVDVDSLSLEKRLSIRLRPNWVERDGYVVDRSCCFRTDFIRHRCPGCGAETRDAWKFCTACGLSRELSDEMILGNHWRDNWVVENPLALWGGTPYHGELAKLLNSDDELTRMLYNEGLDSLEVIADRGQGCIWICHVHEHRYGWEYVGEAHTEAIRIQYEYGMDHHATVVTRGRKQFPTLGAFLAYDRIAQTIKTFIRDYRGAQRERGQLAYELDAETRSAIRGP